MQVTNAPPPPQVVDLTTDVTGDLPFGNLAQGSALSVLGRSANSTGDVASIAAGTDHQVLRRSGTALAFGAINLAQAAAVTGLLAAANGGTGNGFTAFSGPASSTKTFTLPNSSVALAAIDLEDQTLTGGARVTSKSLGTITTGTVTPDPGDRALQHYTNNGAHTLAPGSNRGSYLLDIVNGASAGAITVSGWTKVSGDDFTTTNGNKFRCHCSVGEQGSLLVVQALQ